MLWGRRSRAELIASAIPGAELVVVPGAAHLASVERAVPVTDVLVRHLLPSQVMS